MAPLTRSRHEHQVPTALAPTYYAQRARAGLLVAEATQVSARGQGYPDTPGIYTDAHVDAWREVTSLVHAVGGRIVLQLWHVGRVSHSSYHGGALPVAPSAIAASGQAMTPDFQMVDFETPHALTAGEIAETVRAYAEGARARPGRRLRRRRDPRGEWLPDRAVPRQRDQPPDRRLRRLAGEPAALPDRGDRRRARRLGARARRRARCRSRPAPTASKTPTGPRRSGPSPTCSTGAGSSTSTASARASGAARRSGSTRSRCSGSSSRAP